ncbi:MAG TPA: hypothetical protein VF255_01930 [Solirubrobacterales bacterium]
MVASLLLVLAPPAGALSRVSLGSFGSETGAAGGSIRGGKGLAVNRTGAGGAAAGDVYVGDSSNNRIQQFSAEGEFIRAWGAGVVPGAAAGTANLTSVSGTGTLTAGSNQVTGVTGSFATGQTISGIGIPPETTISSVGVETLTLSKAATASGSGVALIAGEVTSVVTTTKAFVVGQTVTGTGIPAGTRIATVTTGVGAASKLTLSNAVTATATGVTLTVSESPGNVTSNEKQTVTVPAVATGEYKLKFKTTSPNVEAETAPIPVAASAAEVEAALTALANVGAGNVSVTETASRTFQVEFQGKFADTNVEQLTIPAGGQPTGGNVIIATSQQGAQPFEICTVSCAFGAASAVAGGMSGPSGLSVDQETGTVYVVDASNRRVDVFSATGAFEGAFGWEVDASSPAAALQFCTAVTGCRAAAPASEAAGAFSNFAAGLGSSAVDPTDGDLYVSDPGNVRVNEFQLTRNLSGEVTGVSFIRAIGWGVDDGSPALQTCTSATLCQKGLAGNGEGQFSTASVAPSAIAVDSQGNLYVVNLAAASGTSACTAAAPCRILKFDSSGSFLETFGPNAGESTGDECQVNYTAGVQNAVAVIDIAVDPGDDHVFILKGSGAGTYRVYEFDEEGGKAEPASEKCDVSPPLAAAGLPSGGLLNTHGLAVGIDERLYSQNTTIATGRVFILGPAPPPQVKMTSAGATGPNSATLVGEVTPPDEIEGQAFETGYRFEYSTSNSPDPDDWIRTPVPDGSAGSQPVPQEKDAQITGLSANTRYFARLCATTAQTVCSDALEFKTEAIGPTVVLTFSEDVTQNAATLGARIAPNNLPTTYHFEWAGPEEWEADPGSYGHSIPLKDRQIGGGPGGEVVNVEESLTGLSQASLYHFRVVTTNEEGTTFGPDQELETLNSCGLLGRCFELVSPAAKGPVAIPVAGISGTAYDARAQAAPEGDGFAYSVALGFPDATAGEEVNYVSRRDSDGWNSVQISPPAPPSPELRGEASPPSRTKAVTSNLDCGIVASAAPLTSDAPMQVVEAGGMNLFRRDNLTGSYTLITDLPPVNAQGNTEGPDLLVGTDEEYEAVDVSTDCNRFVFRSAYIYPGLPGAKRMHTYEWSEGELSSVALIPGPGGPSEPVAADLVPGGVGNPEEKLTLAEREDFNAWGAVPQAPGQVFFTAKSLSGGDAGRYALFLRRDASGAALDISQSRTATPTRGALFQTATSDGSRVFFLANYGLVAPPEQGGTTEDCTLTTAVQCDLYEWRPQGADGCAEASGCLTDLTADQGHPANTAGAAVRGVLGISANGEYVYLAARGQLDDTGDGRTYAQNVTANTYNVYLLHEGEYDFVGPVGAAQAANGLFVSGPASTASIAAGAISPTSQVTPDGGHLLFESAADVTGYASGGPAEAYLFSAESGETVCVSCRRDGKPSANPSSFRPITRLRSPISPVVSLAADGQKVVFLSFNPLATGSSEGERNLYEWRRGQIVLIDTAEAGNDATRLGAFGISEDGTDLFLRSARQLVAEDVDGRMDVYSARVGGGFPPKPPPPVPCDPLGEGACQGPGSPPPPSAPAPSSSSFFGPGNQPPSSAKNKKKQNKNKKKQNKSKKKKKNNTKKKARAAQGTTRDAGANRGAAE